MAGDLKSQSVLNMFALWNEMLLKAWDEYRDFFLTEINLLDLKRDSKGGVSQGFNSGISY